VSGLSGPAGGHTICPERSGRIEEKTRNGIFKHVRTARQICRCPTNPGRRIGQEPGVKFYTHLSDQFGPYHTKVIAATASEAPHVLDGLLYHQSSLERTLFTLQWLQDPELRRRSYVDLNKGEQQNALRRAVFFNRLGEIRDRS